MAYGNQSCCSTIVMQAPLEPCACEYSALYGRGLRDISTYISVAVSAHSYLSIHVFLLLGFNLGKY